MLRTFRASKRQLLNLERLEDRLTPGVDLSPALAYHLDNDWGSGFTASIRLTNDQSENIDGWKLEFDFDRSIDQIWNGTIVSHSGNHYAIKGASWNNLVTTNGSVEFGFLGSQGSAGSQPSNAVMYWGNDANPPPSSGSVNAAVDFKVDNDWGSGFQATISIKNNGSAPIDNWLLAFDFPNQITQIWNGQIESHSGNHYVIKNAGYNATIAPGATVSFGFLGAPGNVSGSPTNWELNGMPLGASNPPGQTQPNIRIDDVTVSEPAPSVPSAAGYFFTSGNQIVDTEGRNVRIAGVNWFGMETTNYAPHGLWTRNYRDMMDQMKELGFNTIRLPFSNQLFDAGSTPNGIDFAKNPDLVGLNGLQILDKIVDYAGQIGLRIILDHHRSDAGSGPQGSGLWYTDAYPESRWIADWQMLARRYAGNSTVIGADLHNEAHGAATWGTGGVNDWRLAAERAGNAILAENSNWLIIVEGVESGPSGSYWWGGNLSNAGAYPVRLDVAGRLVYSPHDYPASVYPQPWFSSPDYPNNLFDIWDRNWGYLYRQNIAPLLLGEFGTRLETSSDQKWFDAITKYLGGDLNGDGTNDLASGQQGVSWTYWSWNPNSGDTGGILNDDWTTVRQDKVAKLEPVQFEFPHVDDGGSSAPSAPVTMTFTVTLSAPSSQTVMVRYQTEDGTATAGLDYRATNGTLTFEPGETSKTIEVAILPDTDPEGDETFLVRLLDPMGALLEDSAGVGTIR